MLGTIVGNPIGEVCCGYNNDKTLLWFIKNFEFYYILSEKKVRELKNKNPAVIIFSYNEFKDNYDKCIKHIDNFEGSQNHRRCLDVITTYHLDKVYND